MKIMTFAGTIALVLLPTLALAGGACAPRATQTQSCVAGSVWDSGQQECVKQVTG
jgi:hypothetical protein